MTAPITALPKGANLGYKAMDEYAQYRAGQSEGGRWQDHHSRQSRGVSCGTGKTDVVARSGSAGERDERAGAGETVGRERVQGADGRGATGGFDSPGRSREPGGHSQRSRSGGGGSGRGAGGELFAAVAVCVDADPGDAAVRVHHCGLSAVAGDFDDERAGGGGQRVGADAGRVFCVGRAGGDHAGAATDPRQRRQSVAGVAGDRADDVRRADKPGAAGGGGGAQPFSR